MTAEWTGVEEAWRIVAARLAAADRENAELRETLGTERLVHALQEQRLSESGSFRGAPRWDEDRVVIEHDWLDGHCGRCGETIPQPAENAELRGEVERLRALPVWTGQWVQESIADRWKAERDDARAALARLEKTHAGDHRGFIESRRSLVGRIRELETQLAAAQAQLAEAQSALAQGHARLGEVKNEAFLEGGRAESEKRRAAAAEARLEAVRAWVAKAEPYPDLNGNKFAGLHAALSAAPQPEPTHFEITVEGNGALSTRPAFQPEPPASAEPTGRSD